MCQLQKFHLGFSRLNVATKIWQEKSNSENLIHWFKRVTYETASRNGQPFNELLEWASVLPNVRARICSVQLKIRTVMRYIFSLGLTEYAPTIGIRKDEEHRKTEILSSVDSFEHPEFPMIDWGVTERDVLAFWKKQPFDLQLQSYQGNCDLCFLKSKWKRIKIARENPELVGWWKQWELRKSTSMANGVFRLGEPYDLIENLARQSNQQGEFFDTECDVDIPCSCVEKAFRSDEADDDPSR